MLRFYRLMAFVVIASTLSTYAVAPAYALTDVGKVMVVGDSISQGSTGDWTWRYRLGKHLTASGVQADFVGSATGLYSNLTSDPWDTDQSYPDPGFDRDHSASWGVGIDGAAGSIASDVSTRQPDYLLVLLGINDLAWSSRSPAEVELSMRTFIANARSGKSDVKIALGLLLPTSRAVGEPAFAGRVQEVNQRFTALATEQSTTASPVAIADATAGFDPDAHTWDGTHPNARGEVRIAAAFADVLSSRFGIGAPYPRPLDEPAIGPLQPIEATATATGPGKAELTWTLSATATEYRVWAKNEVDTPEWTLLPIPLHAENRPWHMDNLVPGAKYEWKVQAAKGNALGAISSEVALTITGPTPAAAANLTVQPGDYAATLSWTPALNASGYFVHVRDVTANETSFTRLPIPITESSWTAEARNGGTYEFKLQSVNGRIEGGTTAAVSVTLGGSVPGSASGLTVASGNGVADLSWNAATNARGYYILMQNVTRGETGYIQLPWPVPETHWQATGLDNGAEYRFAVRPVNGYLLGPQSSGVTAHPTVSPPAAPTGFSVASGNGEAALTWTPAENATGYFVHVRNVTAGESGFTKLPIAVPGPEWTAAQLENGAAYEFKLQSVSGLIEGGFSTTVVAQPSVAPPPAPAGLTVVNGDHEAALSWTPAANATGYFVHVRNVTAGESGFTKLPIAVPGPEWVAGLLENGARYEFKLQSVSGRIEGGTSTVVVAQPTGPAPSAPTNLVVRPVDGGAVLTWDLSIHATCVYIYTRNVTGGESGFTMLPLPVCGDTWTAGYLANGGTYEYKLQAYNDRIPGTTGSAVSVTLTAPPPAAPENLTAVRGDKKATLQWNGSSQATGYYIWTRNVTDNGQWQQLPWAIGYRSFVANYLVNGVTYEYKVQSVDGYVAGGFSNVVQVVPRGPTPMTGTLRVVAGVGRADLTWTGSSTSTGYYIWMRNVTANESFQQLLLAIPGPTFTASVLPGDVYEFKIQGVSGLQRGSYSNTVAVTIPRPAAPSGVKATVRHAWEVNLSWKAVPGADGYLIYQGMSSDGRTTPELHPLPFPVSSTSWNVGYLFDRGVYHFAVVAMKNGREGPRSTVQTAWLRPPDPASNLELGIDMRDGVRYALLHWNASPMATKYVVWVRNVSTNSGWYRSDTTTGTSHQEPCLGSGIFDFAVEAVNGMGAASWSNAVAALPNDDGWRSYSPKRISSWRVDSDWFWAGSTVDGCPIDMHECFLFVQFRSNLYENVWRIRMDGTTETARISSGHTYRYKRCYPGGMCLGPEEWGTDTNVMCRPPRRIANVIVSIEQNHCFLYLWALP